MARTLTTLETTLSQIAAPDQACAEAAQRIFDFKTKPRGSLGRLEELVCRVAAIRRQPRPAPEPAAIVVVAADHGIAIEGVSAYPQEVTSQMLANFAGGGAAICVLARAAGARLVVVDAGVGQPFTHTAVLDRRLGPGTANASLGPAMTRAQALRGLEHGIGLAEELAAQGIGVIALGDMGIGNTAISGTIAAALLGRNPGEVLGRGTGIDDEGFRRKVATVRRALEANAPDPSDPVGVLAAVGGFEHAVLAGVALGAAAAHVPVVLDGFVVGAAALIAARIAPLASAAMIASHRSTEPGHAVVLEALGLDPLLDLRMRLGEGSGAALGLQLIQDALLLFRDMSTFEGAGVTDAGA
ncbi:MAG TPA: nicotinate-nucleotide--dimethylbenzimidazole phosphoribosyltransferase [Candidatus Limnocylindrales bacterium]|nr:nicotinate-nucleotide--dimethylbenzimidazole phosphoribosyltransferase [Candidatus Limnocylindrales bacterium]